MDKSMTGDGAVVREWHYDGISKREDVHELCLEHNALARHALAKAAEIERLTVKLRDMTTGFNATNEILDREQARAADLLKALERALGYMRNVRIDLDTSTKIKAAKTLDDGIRLVLAAIIAAAKGETV